MARDYKLNDWKTLDPLIDEDLAQGMTLDGIATKHGIGRSALGMHQNKRRKKHAGEAKQLETPQEDTVTEDVVEVLPGQMRLDGHDTAASEPVSTIVDIAPVAEISEPLSSSEVHTLEHYERIIAEGIKTFVQVGHALLTIREHHLYRETYTTFEDYCRQRWD